MAWLGRSRGRRAAASEARRAAEDHLRAWAAERHGVEAYIEPATRTTPTTVVLVALTGEWTRRRVADPAAAREIARALAIPVYDVNLTGYPRRMREWNARQRTAGRPRQIGRAHV